MSPGSYLLSRDLSSDYHRRSNVSLPGSGWDRVGPLGYDHQASGEALGFPLFGAVACVSALEGLLCFFDRLSDGLAAFCWVFACFGRVVCLGWLSGGFVPRGELCFMLFSACLQADIREVVLVGFWPCGGGFFLSRFWCVVFSESFNTGRFEAALSCKRFLCKLFWMLVVLG